MHGSLHLRIFSLIDVIPHSGRLFPTCFKRSKVFFVSLQQDFICTPALTRLGSNIFCAQSKWSKQISRLFPFVFAALFDWDMLVWFGLLWLQVHVRKNVWSTIHVGVHWTISMTDSLTVDLTHPWDLSTCLLGGDTVAIHKLPKGLWHCSWLLFSSRGLWQPENFSISDPPPFH